MNLDMTTTVLILGVVISLLYVEITGILPSGMIVPGYLVLLMKYPMALIATFIVSMITFLVVYGLISKVTILYGKRKFTAMISVALLLMFLANVFLAPSILENTGLAAVGLMVPGLMANTYQRQGFLSTILSTGLVAAIVGILSNLAML